MSARIIDGKAIAAELRARFAAEVRRLGRWVEPGSRLLLIASSKHSRMSIRAFAKKRFRAL